MTELKRTPIYPLYKELGGKTVEFGGWDMPVQFSGILAEHEAVRTQAGLFDVSHMGEFEIEGNDARAFLQHLLTNDVNKIEPGMAMYSPMTYENGGCVDDLLIYCFSPTRFWAVVNAGNIDKDWAWFNENVGSFDVLLTNKSDDIAQIALQGPLAESILQPLTDADLTHLVFYRFVDAVVSGVPVVLSRTGYTGEDGFELYVAAEDAQSLWKSLLAGGEKVGLLPCGLGCRDTLRLEAKLPLYGHELTKDISPLEAGIGMFVKLEAGAFVGRDALAAQKQAGVSRRIVGIQLMERGIPRADYRVFANGQDIGFITSGTMSPTLKEPIGLAMVDVNYAQVGTEVEVDIRNKRVRAQVVKTPFYKRPH